MTPETETALAEAIASARGPLAITGGGTRDFAPEGDPLSTGKLSGIALYEPGALTMVAQAGTPISTIKTALKAENQRLAFEPMDHRPLLGTAGEPTLGGLMAANVSGPRRIQVGAARDFALGVRFVDGAGQIVKNGGRVMKNVTGYDLVKLMCGAYGTLGVLTEVSLKVLPNPETQGSVMIQGLSDEGAVGVMAHGLGSPFEVTGAAHDPGQGITALRVEGFESSVTYRLAQLKALVADCGGEIELADAQASDRFWTGVRDVLPLADGQGDIWRVSCKPSDSPALAAKSGAEARLFDWAGGLVWLRSAPGYDLRAALGDFDGHATLVRGSTDGRAKFQPEAAGVARLSAGLRAKFDPKGILNAGLMGHALEGAA
jgi:glycolate oxidase FAD binding subunit